MAHHLKKATLLGLPPELRLHIYNHIFGPIVPWITLHIHKHVYCLDSPTYLIGQGNGSLSILRTSRHLYEEAAAYLYESTEISICLRAPLARAWSDSSRSLGHIEDVRFWPFVTHCTLTIELRGQMDAVVVLERLGRLLEALGHGKHLRELKVVLSCRDDDAVPECFENIVDTVSTLRISGKARVGFTDSFGEEGEFEKRVCDQIMAAMSA
ncbi:hypothetical protein B0A50_01000 [Salinomyces thailandicus]|uniref:Uncharacterized protein n=1 Tax=Salinomyces thailandicus TaxID=706561 RepID=A0A4U0UEH5_9PEZI|nr:hypothetical protein B0A50_01000 [Salinomyces thailandica]